ncbi:ATP-binding Cassette (ABC) Superfamily [Brachionus plicatilis]|uniref:ATP-binding Cassette (ABC) Superfamily n=1 Tax=Brachionus plicatilis TaxID=10195 RepID=A0A3M7PRM0_BRAPC|nr:ATP-binding Cassette (ABC) Superfamily [Brachionus plicatilis]
MAFDRNKPMSHLANRINSTTNQTEAAHKISQEDYIKHPSNRRLSDEEEKEINSKFETGGDAKMIAQHMSQKTGKWLTRTDMWNIRNKFLSKEKNKEENQYPLKDFEREMNSRITVDQQNFFRLIYDQETSSTLLMVYYQNNEMKKFYAEYGEIVFIDGTYSLNDNNYPVYLITVRDCNGILKL